MTKNELISAVAEACDLTKVEATSVCKSVFDTLGVTIAEEGRFSWPGFGTFTVTERSARDGRNPATGEKIRIAASKGVKFKPSPSLKDEL